MSASDTFVIAGRGLAGAKAAEALREQGSTAGDWIGLVWLVSDCQADLTGRSAGVCRVGRAASAMIVNIVRA